MTTPDKLVGFHKLNPSSPTIQLSTKQLSQLLERLNGKQPVKEGSFFNCTARFDGDYDYAKVAAFISTVSTYKDVEKVSDANALKGLPLLLEGKAFAWWTSIEKTLSTWDNALELIRSTFGLRRPAYQIYLEFFRSIQDEKTATNIFIGEKRALLAELAEPHSESVQLDMIYGLLRPSLRWEIPRESVSTFAELIYRARELKGLEEEKKLKRRPDRALKKKVRRPYPNGRCNVCRRIGHTSVECRKRKLSAPRSNATKTPLKCYGCGKLGFAGSKCSDCGTTTKEPTTGLAFCAVSAVPVTGHGQQSLSTWRM